MLMQKMAEEKEEKKSKAQEDGKPGDSNRGNVTQREMVTELKNHTLIMQCRLLWRARFPMSETDLSLSIGKFCLQ